MRRRCVNIFRDKIVCPSNWFALHHGALEMPRANSISTLEDGSRRRASGGMGGTNMETTRFLRGTRRMSKDGSRRDKAQPTARSRTTRMGERGGLLPALVMVALVIFSYLVATHVSSFVAGLFIPNTAS